MEKAVHTIPEQLLNPQEIYKLSSDVLNGLSNKGYFFLKEKLSETDFQNISSKLGHVFARSELKVDPAQDAIQEARRKYTTKEAKRPSIYTHLGLDFHTDSPIGNRISWYCIKQDEKLGALLLIDSQSLFTHFSEDEKDILSTINLRYIESINGQEEHRWQPLLTRNSEQEEIYFGNWHLKGEYDEQQKSLIEKFKRVLQVARNENLISVRLQPGQSVYVNNRSMLHSRGPISETSRRHIIRLAISSKSRD